LYPRIKGEREEKKHFRGEKRRGEKILEGSLPGQEGGGKEGGELFLYFF